MAASVFYLGNTMVFQVAELKQSDGQYVDPDTSVEVTTIVDATTGAEIDGVTFPLVLSPPVGTDGLFIAELPSDAGMTEGGLYTATVVALTPTNIRGEWKESIRAKVRKG